MLIKTKEFQEVCKTIAPAVDNSKANIELVAKESNLFLNVATREYYVSVKFAVDELTEFHATVEAALFLDLVSSITAETFELTTKANTLVVKCGKSNYKLPMIYENDELVKLPVIAIGNKTVEMNISNDILKSILNVNSKEILKTKNKSIEVNELQKLYYIDETGCFTFVNGACVNSFTLEKPVKLLLNDRIVKLFKLFKTDVYFSMGIDAAPNGSRQSKVTFETENIYVAALITNDDVLINAVQGPCAATKRYINEHYPINVVLSVVSFKEALARLMQFTKNSNSKANMYDVRAKVSVTADEIIITDRADNTESVTIENGSFVDSAYDMTVNLEDFRLVLESCTDEHITVNCGNTKSIVVTRGNINNLIREYSENTDE